jgi:hypothetical protein
MSEEGVGEDQGRFVGLAGVTLPIDSFDLGEGVTIRRTFAHVFAPYLAAFKRPKPGQAHPAPWKALAGGGLGADIEVELCMPPGLKLFEHHGMKTAWWFVALLRLRAARGMMAPVVGTGPLASAADGNCDLFPLELTRRSVLVHSSTPVALNLDALAWVKEHWRTGGQLARENEALLVAVDAADNSFFAHAVPLGLMLLWGALERLFAPQSSEKRFRVSAAIAAFLRSPGPERLELFRNVQKLYVARSGAAHGSRSTATPQVFLDTYSVLSQALLKIITENKVPTPEETDARLFGHEG